MTTDKNLFLRPMTECSLHINPELEIVFVKKGNVSVNVGSYEFTVSANEFTIIQPYRIHSFKPSENTDATVYMFPNSMVSEFYSLCKNMEATTTVFSLDKVTVDYILLATEKYLAESGIYYAKSILNTFLAEFTRDNSFIQMSFDASNLNRIVEYIYFNVSGNITLKDISTEFNIKESQLNRLLMSYTGLGFKEFVNAIRIEKAIVLLSRIDMNITEIAFESGYDNIRTFNRAFLKMTGLTPSQYRKQLM